MHEYSIPDLDESIRKYNPQTLVDVCRLKQFIFHQGHTYLPEYVRHELSIMLLEIDEESLKINDFQSKGNERKNKAPLICTSQKQMNNDNLIQRKKTADIKGKKKYPNKDHYWWRTMERQFQSCRNTIVNEDGSTFKVKPMLTQYDNRFDTFAGETLSLSNVQFYGVVISFHRKITKIEVEIIVRDCKFHIYLFAENIRKEEVYTVCESKLHVDDAPTAKLQDKDMICANPRTESKSLEVENDKVKDDTMFNSQNHEEVVSNDIYEEDVSLLNSCSDKLKNKKQVWWLRPLLYMFFMTLTLNEVKAGYVRQIDEKKLLTSKTCSQQKFYSMKKFCHLDEVAHDMTIDFCNFKDLCGTDEIPVCLNTEEMGVYICLRKDLTCPNGRKVKAWQDKQIPDRVYLQEVDCPNHTFQPTESDCIHACLFQHRNLSDMSEMYILSSKGDNINPTKVYCNFKNGYYNPEDKFILNYDQDEICLNIVDYNPCKEGEIILPDGSCVSECDQGFERNPPYFHCRQSDMAISSSADKIKSSTTKLLPVSTTVSSTTLPSSTKNMATDKVTPELPAHKEKTNETFPWWGYLSCIGGGGLVVLLIVALIVRWGKDNKHEGRMHSVYKEISNTYKIKKASNVYFYGELENSLVLPSNNSVHELQGE